MCHVQDLKSIVSSGARVDSSLVDISGRTGYSLVNAKPVNPYARASEYYQVLRVISIY